MLIQLLKNLLLKGSWHFIKKEPELARQAYMEAIEIINTVAKNKNASILKYINSKAALNTHEASHTYASLSVAENVCDEEDVSVVSAQKEESESFASRLEYEIEFSKIWVLPFIRSLLLFVSDKRPKLTALQKNVHATYLRISPLFNAFQQMSDEDGKEVERDTLVRDEYAKKVISLALAIESYYDFGQYNFLQIFKLMATEQLDKMNSAESNKALDYSLEITRIYSNLAANFDELHACHQFIVADKNAQQVTEHQADQQTGQDRSSCPKEMAVAMRKNAALFKSIYHQRNCKQLLEQDDLAVAGFAQDKASMFIRAIEEFTCAYNLDPTINDNNIRLLLMLRERMNLLALNAIYLGENSICVDLVAHLLQFMKILESAINSVKENSNSNSFKLDIKMTIPEFFYYCYITADDLAKKLEREIKHKKTVDTDDLSRESLDVDSEKSSSQQANQSPGFEDLYFPLEPLSVDTSDYSSEKSPLYLMGMDEYPKVAANPDPIDMFFDDFRNGEINPDDWDVKRVISSAELKGGPLKAPLLPQPEVVIQGSRKNIPAVAQSESAAQSPVKNAPASTQPHRVVTTSSSMCHSPKRDLPLMGDATGSPIKVASLSMKSRIQSVGNSPTKITAPAATSKKEADENPRKITQLLDTAGLFGALGNSRNGASSSCVGDRRSKKRGSGIQGQVTQTVPEMPAKRVTRSAMRRPFGIINE